ncbi:MAG TPA: hypothetical protein VN328_10880 [Thermodesulfovibrionales bacterium]|nr:hypothetical protein [Thermodesulfovibrionales bacterium]
MAAIDRDSVSSANDNEQSLIAWDNRIRILSNPILWGNFLLVFGLPIFLLSLLLIFPAGIKTTLLFMGGIFIFFAVIWAIVGFFIDLAEGFHASYQLTSKGIYFSSGRTAKKAAKAVTVIGVLSRSASVAGAGLLARSEQDQFIGWNEIRKVKVRKGSRYIFVRKGFGSKPVGLYCTEENFEEVLKLIQTRGLRGVMAK